MWEIWKYPNSALSKISVWFKAANRSTANICCWRHALFYPEKFPENCASVSGWRNLCIDTFMNAFVSLVFTQRLNDAVCIRCLLKNCKLSQIWTLQRWRCADMCSKHTAVSLNVFCRSVQSSSHDCVFMCDNNNIPLSQSELGFFFECNGLFMVEWVAVDKTKYRV